MLRRKIIDELRQWRQDRDGKCLLIKGPRQIGKTFIVEQFGKEYESFVKIDFITNPSYKRIFEGDLDVDTIVRMISAFDKNVRFIPGRTLLFFDEVQECPRARTSLKPFAIDGRYDVIAAGSFTGVHIKGSLNAPVPVGYERELRMNSLDFEEYLWAVGMDPAFIDDVRRRIRDLDGLGPAVYDLMSAHFRDYMVVGGMPRAVSKFVSDGIYSTAWEENRNILRSCIDDIERYVTGPNMSKTKACFESVPRQLAKPNRRFVYADLDPDDPNAARKYEGNLLWLRDANVVTYCNRLNQPLVPLSANVDEKAFKVYMHDIGLLTASYEYDLVSRIVAPESDAYIGAIVENCISACIERLGRTPYYFEKKGKFEIDFVTMVHGGVAAIEVKSGNNRTSLSLDRLESYGHHVDRRIKLENSDIMLDDDGVEHYPLFCAGFLDDMHP